MRKYLFLIIILGLSLLFFRSVVFSGKMPIPADTIIGLYHPFRDLFAKDYPRGLPFKNFLITDPVRQQYPWRYLSINSEKKLQLPLWNPYNFAGTPLLANFQSASLYPLNFVFFILPFNYAWTLLIVMQTLLASLFMYWYLRYLKLERISAFLGGFVFAFSGSSIAWIQWNTVVQTIIWLPLILLAGEHVLQKYSKKWIGIFIVAQICAILAGHLQTLFYVFIVTYAYILIRSKQLTIGRKTIVTLLISIIIVLVVSAIQWLPTLQFILLSARDIDLSSGKEGWFIPFQHLIQFIAPDFFGNPATLNYWGVWNYAEFIGYVSIAPILLTIYALLFKKDRNVIFFGVVLLISLIFATKNPISQIPFALNIPLVSTSQPTRLIIIADFAIAILSALGLDYFLKTKKNIYVPILVVLAIFVGLWTVVLFNQFNISLESLLVAKRNLVLPTGIFVLTSILLLLYSFVQKKKVYVSILILLIGIVVYDLFRLGDKFLPFVNQNYIFPSTKTIEFLQKNAGICRIMSVDDRILPPNFSAMYKLQTVDGYDPLYLRRYGELISASERGKPNIDPPFGFNRIITPKNYDSKIIDLLGVKYVLSLSDLSSPKLSKVFQEGETRIYQNNKVIPRAFFAEQIYYSKNKQDQVDALFRENVDLSKIAVLEYALNPESRKVQMAPGSFSSVWSVGNAQIVFYSENKVIIETENKENGYLVFTDSFYPSWKVIIDGEEGYAHVDIVDYNFRGVGVPKGKHTVIFYNTLL